MTFDPITRKLTSGTGYIHSLDDGLYSDHPIYLGVNDLPENYEEGNEAGYVSWKEGQDAEVPQNQA